MVYEPMVSTSHPGKEHGDDILINELLLWMITNHINLTLSVIVVEVPWQQPTCRGEYFTRRTMCQSMHIESTPREGPINEVDLEMNEIINRYLRTKK